ncbi:MAG: hypothetical protein ACI9FN_003668 [Saprospiraceae bacterium]|jgi:hypothetical protein
MINRRKFIKASSAISGGLTLYPFLDAQKGIFENPLQLEIYATNWGFTGSMKEFCRAAKEDGYDGIEVWTSKDAAKRRELLELIKEFDLRLGLLAGNWGSTFEGHLKDFDMSLKNATDMQPEFINCHSGKDYFNYEQGQTFITLAQSWSEKTSIPIYHETHRGRMLYAAHVASHFINSNPNLRITLDISHWCNVHESLLEDQKSTIASALERVDHIHSRVGFQEAPQIPNHDDPQYEAAVKAHFAWWDRVVEIKKRDNQKLTMTAEFGPPPYMWTTPYTAKPLAEVWEVNSAMKDLWRKRYQNK